MGESTLDICLTEHPGKWPQVECPARPPQGAQALCIVYWLYGPGWFVKYLLSTNQDGTLWILWAQDDRGGDWGWGWGWETAVPLAWCSRQSVSRDEAAVALLRAWWRNLRDRNQGQVGSLEEAESIYQKELISESGLLPIATLAQLKEELWPTGAADKIPRC